MLALQTENKSSTISEKQKSMTSIKNSKPYGIQNPMGLARSRTILQIPWPKTVAELVVKAQEGLRGCHFCELAIIPRGQAMILTKTSFLPVPTFLDQAKTETGNETLAVLELPARLEHLLVIIRNTFPGVNFHDLRIENEGGKVVIKKTY